MNRPKAVVCGTGFGRIYLAGLAAPDSPAELVGVLARGGDRSRACARRYDVPLYTCVADLPSDVDIACVVVGSSVTGGPGARLAVDLLRRGVHVLQEHPVHGGELSEILRVVADTGVHYMLNSHHVHVAGVRRFVGAARELLRRQPPAFVDVATSVQVLYTVLDILGVTLDRLRPWGFARPADLPDAVRRRLGRDIPFRSLDGMLGGVPATVRVQHQMDPRQPDNHAHLWHRITLGTEGGTLTLIGGNGPVLWCPRSHLPPSAASLAGFDELSADHIDYPSAEPIGAADAPSFADVLRHTWPQAVATAVARLWSAVCDKADPLRDGQYHLMLGRLSADVLDLLGPLELVSRSTPRVLAAADLTPAAVAAEAASIGKVPT